MPTNLVVVQTIQTEWTKASRGSHNASLRNSVPEALKLKLPTSFKAETQPIYLHQTVNYGERNQFQTALKNEVEIKLVEQELKQGSIGIYLRDNQLKVVFEDVSLYAKTFQEVGFDYSGYSMGAPRRIVDLEAFSLAPDQWGRVRYNGRFNLGYDMFYTYEKWIFNIGLFLGVPSADVFVETTPDHIYSKMADLW